MKIELEVFATLRDQLKEVLPGGRGTVEVGDGATVRQVAEQFGISLAGRCAIMVNERLAVDRDQVLEENSKLTFIPPVAGGG